MEQSHLRLFELNKLIKDALLDAFPVSYWIVAEISEIRQNRSGHVYLELIEKDEFSDQIVAKARATIWASTFRMLKPYFELTTGEVLRDGMKVLVNVSVEFHELYSFSLNIKDIDPTYTMGDLARKRQEIINRLEDEGVIDMNKDLMLPDLVQKIAVISSETAAGLDDFQNQLHNNEYGLTFYIKIFPATMQGHQAEQSIMNAMDSIYKYEDFFDVVVIIRGGGSKADLSCFDSYNLSYYITQFPLPVFTGIGHERDDSIVDMVANTRLKTPTAVAEYLISRMLDRMIDLDNLKDRFLNSTKEKLLSGKERLQDASYRFVPVVRQKLATANRLLLLLTSKINLITGKSLSSEHLKMHDYAVELKYSTRKSLEQLQQRLNTYPDVFRNTLTGLISNQKQQLDFKESTTTHLDPVNILKRGYTLTTLNGKLVKSATSLKDADEIKTRFRDGSVKSVVKK